MRRQLREIALLERGQPIEYVLYHKRPLMKPSLYSQALGEHTKLPLGVLVQLNRLGNPHRSSLLGGWSMPGTMSSTTSRALH